MSSTSIESTGPGTDLAGSLPLFRLEPGSTLGDSALLPDLRQKRLLFNRITQPEQIHVYRAPCAAGARVRVQLYVPALPMSGAVTPAFAIVGKSLPYSADMERLPLDLPAGYSAVVAPSPSELTTPVTDVLTRVQYYPGPIIDTRTLVGGHCYIVVWSPQNTMGKYVLQTGHRWPLRGSYWAQIPLFWWQIRGWFGLSRAAGWIAATIILLLLLIVLSGKQSKATNGKR